MMYDVIIIGAGPAGLTASIYASCYNLSHIVIGRVIGGQLMLAPNIINYPGFDQGVTGKELAELMLAQVKKLGAEVIIDETTSLSKHDEGWLLKTRTGQTHITRAVIFATGTERRKLNVPGENEYAGRGVYYCATCESQTYAGKNVAIIGGGNSAISAAIQIAAKAKTVTIIYRGAELRADPYQLDQLKKLTNVVSILNMLTKEITGDANSVTAIGIGSMQGTIERQIPVNCIFIEIGGVPGAALAAEVGVALTQHGYIIVDHKLQTNIAGIFAAGDIVGDELSMEQITTAVGLGARAAASSYFYLKTRHAPAVWGSAKIQR